MDEFEDIIGYEGLYCINKNGIVMNKKTKKHLKHSVNSKNYIVLTLFKNTKSQKFKLHRLLALQFIENPNNYDTIDHIDRNTLNNKLDNLRWITKSGNNRNCFKPKKSSQFRGVWFHKNRKSPKKWRSHIRINNKKIILGYFETEIEASECYEKKYNEIMETFN